MTHLVTGRYLLGDELGRGGMAQVVAGTDTRLNRPVAVKVLRADLAADPSFLARFRREAMSAAGLNHPNIVAVYDSGEDSLIDDVSAPIVPFIVMELVEGVTLKALLASGRRLLPERAAEMTESLLDALAYAHSMGIVHRDVKPANVMVTRDGRIKVMDFGIARSIADPSATLTQTSAVLGTAQYLSPEQARGEPVDARSDLYGVGCLLFELLTSRPPFTGDSAVTVAYKQVQETPVAPSSIDPSLPRGYDTVVLGALEKSPADRYQSAAAMEDDLARVRRGLTPVGPLGAGPIGAGHAGGGPTGGPRQAAGAVVPLPVGSTQVLPSGRGGYQQGGYQQTGVLAYSGGTGPIPVTKSRSAGRVALWVVLGLAVVGVFVLLFWLGRSLFSATATSVQVPNLVGIQITAVDATLKNNNLTVGLATNANSDKPKGEVIDQDPRAGQPVQPGSLVNVTVSAGKEQVSVPILVGLSKDAAIAALQRASLNPGKITEKDSDRPAGQVLSVNPAEGQNVDSGSSVTLVVSTGKVPVPNVVTETEAQARSDLANAGFNPNVVQQVSDKTPGIVLAQSPLAGMKLVQGSLVTITVAVAAPTTASPPPTTAPPTSAPPTSPPPTSPPPTSAPPTSPPPTSPSVSRPPSSTATP